MSASLARKQRRTMQRNAEAVDDAVEGDRRFFARHPHRRYRVRPLSRAERAQIETLQSGVFDLTPDKPIAYAALKVITPGTRLKLVVFGPDWLVGEELTEAEAQTVYENAAAYQPDLPAREAALRAAMRLPGGPLHEGGA